jgi:hypothetical protein
VTKVSLLQYSLSVFCWSCNNLATFDTIKFQYKLNSCRCGVQSNYDWFCKIRWLLLFLPKVSPPDACYKCSNVVFFIPDLSHCLLSDGKVTAWNGTVISSLSDLNPDDQTSVSHDSRNSLMTRTLIEPRGTARHVSYPLATLTVSVSEWLAP